MSHKKKSGRRRQRNESSRNKSRSRQGSLISHPPCGRRRMPVSPKGSQDTGRPCVRSLRYGSFRYAFLKPRPRRAVPLLAVAHSAREGPTLGRVRTLVRRGSDVPPARHSLPRPCFAAPGGSQGGSRSASGYLILHPLPRLPPSEKSAALRISPQGNTFIGSVQIRSAQAFLAFLAARSSSFRAFSASASAAAILSSSTRAMMASSAASPRRAPRRTTRV